MKPQLFSLKHNLDVRWPYCPFRNGFGIDRTPEQQASAEAFDVVIAAAKMKREIAAATNGEGSV